MNLRKRLSVDLKHNLEDAHYSASIDAEHELEEIRKHVEALRVQFELRKKVEEQRRIGKDE